MSPREFTADQLEELFHASLKAGDVEAVDHVLRAMIVIDPRRALRLHDDLQIALSLSLVSVHPAESADGSQR